MSGARAELALDCRGTRRTVALDDFIDAGIREHAAVEANRWIKALRLARVDGTTLRDRFHHRGDSLWWFTELYLHKEARVVQWLETIGAIERCLDVQRPDRVTLTAGTNDHALILQRVAQGRETAVDPPSPATTAARDGLTLEARARFYTWSARLSRLRARPVNNGGRPGGLVAFVHSAFWRRQARAVGRDEAAAVSGEEGYIGSVIDAVRAACTDRDLTLVGVGPRVNFRARPWWHGVTAGEQDAQLPFAPIEAFASREALAPSSAVWRRRRRDQQALLGSPDVRAAARVGGYDLWPLVASELRGVVQLQWPWSARAMDEAGATLDALGPGAVFTYAEAGGWGRAIVLEARRRGIPTVGIQHGFIYRHWLNYLHEPDEMAPSAQVATDAGFPRPTRTLLFDRYAEEHLRRAGRFPAETLEVTGNPRLDALAAAFSRLTDSDFEAARRAVQAEPGEQIVLVAAKYTQIHRVFRALAEAASGLPAVRLVVKCHPAETPEPYVRDAAGLSRVEIAGAESDLARLLAISRGVVTVNSTVAIDALTLGIPALVVDLPNNLTPFVELGVMLGASSREAIRPRLTALLDGTGREQVLAQRAAFLEKYQIRSDGGAAVRAARSICSLASVRRLDGGPPQA